MKIFCIYLFVLSGLISCRHKKILSQNIIIFKDKIGIYEYDSKQKKESLIFKANDKQIFLNEGCLFHNDTMTFAIKGDFKISHNQGERITQYFKEYYLVNLVTKENWLTKKIFYTQSNNNEVSVKTINYSLTGKVILINDTITESNYSSNGYKNVSFQNYAIGFSKSSVGEVSVFSQQGSLYIVKKNDTSLLFKFNGHFSSKFQCGFMEPVIDPSCSYAVFMNAPESFSFDTINRILFQKINLKSKMVSNIKKGVFSDTQFSKNGKFILYKRDETEGDNNTWTSAIYVMDLESLQETKISNGFNAIWRANR
jgi:hypothetical protein